MRVVCLFAAVVLAVPAADITGKWKGQMESGREAVFDLKQDGTKVTGSMAGPNGEARKITQGELTGDNISLTVASEWEGNPVKLLVKGKVTGNEMKLSIEAESGGWGTSAVVKKEAAPSSSRDFNGQWSGTSASGDFRIRLLSADAREISFTLAGTDVKTKITSFKLDGNSIEAAYEFLLGENRLESRIVGKLDADTGSGTYKTKALANGSDVDEGTWKVARRP
jgi:hypothetical protein